MSEIVKFDFQGDRLDVVRDGDRLWVSVRHICDALGMDRKAQQEKLQAKLWAVGGFKALPAGDGKMYDAYCIDVDTLPMWLATIEPSRVKPAVRSKLIRYQLDAARVLADHFLGRRQSAQPDPRLHVEAHATLSDCPRDLRRMARDIHEAANLTSVSFHKVHGQIRKERGVTSYKRLPQYLAPVVEDWLRAIIDGQIVVRALLPPPQASLPGLNTEH